MKRFYIIDALRCVLALCVVIGHAGMFPLFGAVGQSHGYLELFARGLRTVVFGPPAVIAFFVISGFCIHYPFAEAKIRCPILRFYARRYTRILVPILFTVAIFKMVFPRTIVFGNDSILWHSTLWSVVCEEIYYAIYPLLNRLSAQTGWVNIIKATFITSILISGYFYEAVEWQDIGVVATAVTLFPVWLLGCYLAEHVSELKKVCSARRIWLWRVTAVVAMWMALVLHFHLGIHQTQTGLWIGVLYYFWIREELSYYRTRSPWNLLIWGGRWSYSLYLTHPIIVAVCLKYGVKAYASRLDWLVVIALVFIASYTFYLVVERPTHNQARKISLFSRGRRILPTTAAGAH